MKKIPYLLLAVLFAISTVTPSFNAAAPASGEYVLPVLSVMGVMNGDENGNLSLSALVTRAEFVKMAVTASALKSKGEAPATLSPYPDVKAGSWYSGYVTAARDGGLITGYLDGTFRPQKTVTLEEAVSIILKAMGYGEQDLAAGFPAAHLTLYHSLSLDDDMSAQPGQALTRADCAQLIYNCLNARAKSGSVYAMQLGYTLDAQGKIDYTALTNSLTEGPVLATSSSVRDAVGFDPLTVYRDRRAASAADIAINDVLYYLKDTRTVWAYSQKVSGVVQAISPSTLSPQSVTVSGVTVTLGSSQASYDFSDLGTVKLGDRVTLLLGSGSQCVYVLKDESVSDTVYGVATEVGTSAFSDSLGSMIQRGSITVASADGNTYTYPYSGSVKAGDPVRVTLTGEDVKIEKVNSSSSLSGVVRESSIGGYTLDDETNILDVCSTRAVTISPRRLEGVSIRESDVTLCKTTDSHLDTLILKDVTGDMHDYGIATSVVKSSNLMQSPSVYVYVVRGIPGSLTVSSNFNVQQGPCAVIYEKGTVKSLRSLRGGKADTISEFSVTLSDEGEMSLSSDPQVYLKDGDSWYLSSLREVSLDTHDIRAYYDDEVSNGGQVRVLVAEEK